MQYYQCNKYPVEFVLSENMDKYFGTHNHVKHYVISVVMHGMAAVCLEDREMMCYRGDVFIIPPYAVHSVRQGKNTRLLSMCIGTAFIEDNDLETIEESIQDLLKDAAAQGIFGREQEERLLASVQAVYTFRDNARKEMDADIKTLIDRITSHPEQELPIETLAADIYVSKYYLIRKFKNCIGMTPHQFCIQNRIRKSQGMLNEEMTISGIAAEMGFYDQSHFDRAFRRIVGISPSEYIQSKRQIGQGV